MTSSGLPDPMPGPGEGSSDEIDSEIPGDGRICSDEEINDFVDGAKEGDEIGPKPGTDEGLGRAATSASKRAETSKTLVEELQEHLDTEPVHGKIRKFHVPPEYAAVFAGATIAGESDRHYFVQTADWFKQTVDRYKTGFYDPAVVDQDILRLQAQMVYFAGWVNHLDGVSTDAESTMKQAQQRAYLEGRQWVEANGINPRAVSGDMLNALASEAVKDRGDWFMTARVTAETVKGFYFALKDFIMYLDRVSQRAQPERIRERRHT
jgi:hypothetical protein